MNSFTLFLLMATIFCCASAYSEIQDKLSVTGANDLRFIVDNNYNKTARYFNDWADLNVDYGNMFTFQLGYEAHFPPPPKSFDTVTEQRIVRRSIEFNRDRFSIIAGTFDAILGNGITLRSFTNRDLNWNSDLDGVYASYNSDKLEAKLIGARPRDLLGNRQNPLEAADVTYYPIKNITTGVTYVITNGNSDDSVAYWGSLYGGFSLPFLEFKAEYAARQFGEHETRKSYFFSDYNKTFPRGKAAYGLLNINLQPLSILIEGKHYSKFNLYDGAVYNNPPLVAHEHLFSLFNKKLLVQQADDEMGYLSEINYRIRDNTMVLLSYSDTRSLSNQLRYQDAYAQGEFELPTQFAWIVGTGYLKDASSGNFNLGIHSTLPITQAISANAQFEHQHTTISANSRMYYSQDYTLSISRAPGLTVGALMQITTDQTEKADITMGGKRAWAGVFANMTFMKSNDLSFFAGTRQKGKICAAGICMEKPSLRGIEVTLNSKF